MMKQFILTVLFCIISVIGFSQGAKVPLYNAYLQNNLNANGQSIINANTISASTGNFLNITGNYTGQVNWTNVVNTGFLPEWDILSTNVLSLYYPNSNPLNFQTYAQVINDASNYLQIQGVPINGPIIQTSDARGFASTNISGVWLLNEPNFLGGIYDYNWALAGGGGSGGHDGTGEVEIGGVLEGLNAANLQNLNAGALNGRISTNNLPVTIPSNNLPLSIVFQSGKATNIYALNLTGTNSALVGTTVETGFVNFVSSQPIGTPVINFLSKSFTNGFGVSFGDPVFAPPSAYSIFDLFGEGNLEQILDYRDAIGGNIGQLTIYASNIFAAPITGTSGNFSGNLTANTFIGNGSGLTGVISSSASTAGLATNVVSGISITNATENNVTATGTFTGNGAGLTNVTATNVNGGYANLMLGTNSGNYPRSLRVTNLSQFTEPITMDNPSGEPYMPFDYIRNKALTNQVKILIIGDSYADDVRTYMSWPYWFVHNLWGLWGCAGMGFQNPDADGAPTLSDNTFTNYWWGIGAGSDNVNYAGLGLLRWSPSATSGSITSALIGANIPVNLVQFYYIKQPLGGTEVMSISGGSSPQFNVSTFNATANVATTNLYVSVTNINYAAGYPISGTNMFVGVIMENTNAHGVVYLNEGGNGPIATGSLSLGNMMSVGTNIMTQVFSNMAPDLVIYSAYDYTEGGSTTAAMMQSNWLAVMNCLPSGTPVIATLQWAWQNMADTNSQLTTNNDVLRSAVEYQQSLGKPYYYLDLFDNYPNAANINGSPVNLMNGDSLHPNAYTGAYALAKTAAVLCHLPWLENNPYQIVSSSTTALNGNLSVGNIISSGGETITNQLIVTQGSNAPPNGAITVGANQNSTSITANTAKYGFIQVISYGGTNGDTSLIGADSENGYMKGFLGGLINTASPNYWDINLGGSLQWEFGPGSLSDTSIGGNNIAIKGKYFGNGSGLTNLTAATVSTAGPLVTTNPATGQLQSTYNGGALTNDVRGNVIFVTVTNAPYVMGQADLTGMYSSNLDIYQCWTNTIITLPTPPTQTAQFQIQLATNLSVTLTNGGAAWQFYVANGAIESFTNRLVIPAYGGKALLLYSTTFGASNFWSVALSHTTKQEITDIASNAIAPGGTYIAGSGANLTGILPSGISTNGSSSGWVLTSSNNSTSWQPVPSGGSIVAFAFTNSPATAKVIPVTNSPSANSVLYSPDGTNTAFYPLSTNGAVIINTNFVSGQPYTNNVYGFPLIVSGNAILTTAAVSGMSQMALVVVGSVTNYCTQVTAVTGGLTGTMTNAIAAAFVPVNSVYYFTNTSSGIGDSSTTYGGQIYYVNPLSIGGNSTPVIFTNVAFLNQNATNTYITFTSPSSATQFTLHGSFNSTGAGASSMQLYIQFTDENGTVDTDFVIAQKLGAQLSTTTGQNIPTTAGIYSFIPIDFVPQANTTVIVYSSSSTGVGGAGNMRIWFTTP